MFQIQYETDTIKPESETIKLETMGVIFETDAFNH